jgi:hypothetical protein
VAERYASTCVYAVYRSQGSRQATRMAKVTCVDSGDTR